MIPLIPWLFNLDQFAYGHHVLEIKNKTHTVAPSKKQDTATGHKQDKSIFWALNIAQFFN